MTNSTESDSITPPSILPNTNSPLPEQRKEEMESKIADMQTVRRKAQIYMCTLNHDRNTNLFEFLARCKETEQADLVKTERSIPKDLNFEQTNNHWRGGLGSEANRKNVWFCYFSTVTHCYTSPSKPSQTLFTFPKHAASKPLGGVQNCHS